MEIYLGKTPKINTASFLDTQKKGAPFKTTKSRNSVKKYIFERFKKQKMVFQALKNVDEVTLL